MSQKANFDQIPFFRNGCSVTILLLAAIFLTASAAIAAGPKAYVGNFKDNTISVIDVELKRVTATIPVPPGPHGIAITADNRWVYVASDGASTVSVIDTATDKLVENIEVGKNPHGVAVEPGRQVCPGRGVRHRFSRSHRYHHSQSGRQRCSGQAAQHRRPSKWTARLCWITITGQVLARDHRPGGSQAHEYAYLWKRPRADWSSAPAEDTYISPRRALIPWSWSIRAGNKIVGEIPVGVSPHYANFTADGKRGLTAVQGPSLLAVFNPQTNSVEKSIKVGSRPHWVAGGPGGKTALTTNEDSNDVSIVDLESGTVTNIASRQCAAKDCGANGSDRSNDLRVGG